MTTKEQIEAACEKAIHDLKVILDGSSDRTIQQACSVVEDQFMNLEPGNNVYVVLGLDSRIEGTFSSFKAAKRMVEDKLLMSADIKNGIWTYGTKYTDAFRHVSIIQINTIIKKEVQ